MDDDNGRAVLPILTLAWPPQAKERTLLAGEWLLTNGLGGYAAGTVAACSTRKYHGLLNANLPGRGRMLLLGRIEESATVGGATHRLDCVETTDGEVTHSALASLQAFRLCGLLPEWEYAVGGTVLRKRLLLVHGEDTIHLSYENLGDAEVTLNLRPYPTFRSHDGPLLRSSAKEPTATSEGPGIVLHAAPDAPELRVRTYGADATFSAEPRSTAPMQYRFERARGYEWVEVQRSPGLFRVTLPPGASVALGFTAGSWEQLERTHDEAREHELARERRLLEQAPKKARTGVGARLVLAADQFVIEPTHRVTDEALAHAVGEDTRSVIAGYPWFTDWGRDTMISLEGLTLATGRVREAKAILRTFQHHVRDGLLPNLFPEGESQGLYHTADATLWMFHALHRTLQKSPDRGLLESVFPTLAGIIQKHLEGTRFHIGVDPADGLLRQGEKGYQLTWMDAKVDGWVVTPRRGKAVELNALWFNALSLMIGWAGELGQDVSAYREAAERCVASFNQRFWNEETGCLFDVVDGEDGKDDPAVRPNQVFAISLDHPVLAKARWAPVLEKVEAALLTPVGLRTLSPGHKDFKPRYDGDLRARDAAYHQGTVWPWLLGHFVDATVKASGDAQRGRALLAGLERHLNEACLGQVSEIFDATEPFRPRGCFAQAWSVAEMLRVWLETA